MSDAKGRTVQPVLALFVAVGILFSTMQLAQQARDSRIYRQSRLISRILSEGSIGTADILTNRNNLNTLVKFAGAVTSAYINFELIPVNEAGTFMAVFESLSDSIVVDRFQYRRRDISIYGSAADEGSYRDFVNGLRGSGHFQGVEGHYYLAVDDTLRFEIKCSAAVASYLALY